MSRGAPRAATNRRPIYASTLPAGCVATSVNGGQGVAMRGTYYEAYGGRYVVVYID